MLTGLHLLRQGVDAAARDRVLDLVERQARHLNRLVDDLLDASRIAIGRMQVRQERLDLARLVRTTAEDCRGTVEQLGRTLTVVTPETPVWVQGDDMRLSQAVHNLLDNAAKFTESGGQVRIEVVKGSREAFVRVLDTGVGIDAEMLRRVFEVFAQADQTLDRARGGLGLGLAVVKGVIDLHGGRVHVYSDGPGRGAEFTFWLPVQEEPAAVSGSIQRDGKPADGRRARVVLVEDNRDAADSLCLLLEALGYDVTVAYTGPEGVRVAGERRPGVVISDIGLPGLDGYGVAEALRRDPATAHALLIALSGYNQDEDFRRAREAGFDHYLVKPASPEEIQRLLPDEESAPGREQTGSW
jgi:CheY-like chemotaxis protein